MMPGETPPPPAETAAAGRTCASCGVLQQNMNEYVAALIALKQKIIDGDHLLTEYQQKCTELQFAEREISALRCQVEKMLQKILPLEKCQEELGSVKAELEEKKNSLKIYQESQLEYVKIKEEILNSDAMRKKLETKVKKLEEAARKHAQDFRQLKTEKKRLEKELKKAQGKLGGVIKEKCRKLKHAETQSSSEDLATYIDKGRAMFLLEQLRMCIDSAKGERENEKNYPVLDTIQIHQKIRKSDGKTLPWCSSGEGAVKQNSGTAMIIQTSTEPFGDDCAVNRTTEEQLHSSEDENVDVIIQTGREHSASGFSSQEWRDPDGNVMDILNWARPLPALLSPVQLSPLTTQDMFLGEVTGSSDEEDDCSTSALEDILQEDQVQPLSCNVISPGDECNRQCKSCEHGFDAEISLNLSWNEKNIHMSPKTSRKERDAEREQVEGATLMTSMTTNKNCLEENSGDVETENRKLTGATAHKLEDMEERKGDGEDMNSEEGDSSADFMLQSFKSQKQVEKCSVVEQTEENVTLIRAVDNEGTHEKCDELVNVERNKLVAQREASREASVLQSVSHFLSKQCIVLQREDAEEKSDELIENKSKNVVKLTNVTGAIEISAHSQCSEIKYDSEEILEEQHMHTKDKVNRECEPETVEVSRDYLPVSATEGIRILSVFPNDEHLKTEDMNITRAPTPELPMKFNRGSVLEIAELSELLHSAENVKLVDIKEVVGLQSKPHHEEDGGNLSQRKSNLENILSLSKTACIIGAESNVAKCKSSAFDFTEVKDEIKQSENLCKTLECGQSKSQNFRLFESLETEVRVNPEDSGGEISELLARGDTIESVLIESNPISEEQCAKPLTQLLITENFKCDEIEGKLNKQSKEFVTETCFSSLKQEKNVVKKNDISEIICHPTSEMEYRSGLAFSTQKDLEKCCINNEETNSPMQVGIGLESTRSPDLNFSLPKVVGFLETNLAGKAAFSCTWENKGHTNSIMSSTFNCSSDNLEEGAEILSTEQVNMGKEPDCPEREYVHKNEETTSDKEQPVDKESQASVKSQIIYANPYKNAFLRKFDCQESGCRTSTWKVRTGPSRTYSLTGGRESKELNSFVGSGKNAIVNCKSDFDMPEQSNDSEEKDCSIQKVKYVKCSECVPMFRNKMRPSSRIALGALETGAIVDADYQVCELHSMMHPGSTFAVSHLKADTVVGMNTHCEPNNSGDTANEWSSVTGESYPEDSASWKTECILLTSENTESANELMESNIAGCISHNEESLLKSGTSKESLVTPKASKNRLPLCKMLSRFSENCRLTVKTSKLNARMLALGNFLEENDFAKLRSNGKQGLLHSVDMGVSVFEEYNNNNQTTCNTGESSTDVIIDSGTKKNLLNYLPNPTLSDVRCSCQTVGQLSEPQKTVFEKLHMVESESCALKKSNKWKCKEQELSEILTVSTKTTAQVMHTKLSKKLVRGKRKTKTLTQPVLANANTSVAKKCSSEMINKIREEIGPPLPPLLLPLIATPPKIACTVSSVMSSTGQFSLLSPLDDLMSPLCRTPVLPLMSPLTGTPAVKSAILFSPPSPSEMAVGGRIRSSPLKFCTSIPKHALLVPGRFPLFAAVSAGPGAPQENSVKILDTMYPELSARARTLNILKGNIQLNRCTFSDSQSLPGPASQVGGFKAFASTSTAFVKAGSNLKSDSGKYEDKDVQNQQFFSNHLGKRTLLQVSMPRSAKRLRLESEPPRMEPSDVIAVRNTKKTISEMQEAFHGITYEISDSSQCSNLEESLPVKKDSDCQKVSLALKKVAESCFDLLPVIKGHVYVGNISKIPVMRDEEREVVYEFGIKNKHLAESLLCVILNKLKAQKNAPNYNFSQALCRLYAGICRQLGDLERARLFCYSLLKEDYPDSEKLILFITNVWSDIFVFQGAINKAMQLVVRKSASNEMLACLSAYLNWEQSSSLDAGIMVSNLLLEMQSCTKVEFHLHEQYGEDLSEDAWQYIFAVDLLCSHMKWDWTHDNVISKVLWPSMDNWIKKRKGHETAQSIRDSVIALTLRLIGRLGQIGLKEGYLAAVKNISSVIGLFVQHAKEEAIPWGVQLAAIYSLCDLGSSNPEGIVEAIHTWRAKVHYNIPSAITDGIAEITSLCEMELY
ncbi:little elongation complex subunit 1 isoform X1 [Ammospiza nelsoni]|uniref:little elongation complex subunit 1 isoform X1 n=2 Tax=Ammospiza nelsoni TaxID=2857394 RepID=UPI0028698408|nr:little elongation complex subunit 1 isoform X1 [Ammospiza nelsoni]